MILKTTLIYTVAAIFFDSYLHAQDLTAVETAKTVETTSDNSVEMETFSTEATGAETSDKMQPDAQSTDEPTNEAENSDRMPAGTGKPLSNRKEPQPLQSLQPRQTHVQRSAKRLPSANTRPFRYCPELRSMVTEILEYEARGFAYPWSVPACQDRSIFKAFNPGLEDGGDGPVVSPDVIVADPTKPYEIISVRQVDEERYRADFYIFTRDKSGQVTKTRSSLGFIVADGPQAKDPDVGCVIYTEPPKKQFVRQDCIDLKRSPGQRRK